MHYIERFWQLKFRAMIVRLDLCLVFSKFLNPCLLDGQTRLVFSLLQILCWCCFASKAATQTIVQLSFGLNELNVNLNQAKINVNFRYINFKAAKINLDILRVILANAIERKWGNLRETEKSRCVQLFMKGLSIDYWMGENRQEWRPFFQLTIDF